MMGIGLPDHGTQLGTAMVAVDQFHTIHRPPRPTQGRINGGLGLPPGHTMKIQPYGAALHALLLLLRFSYYVPVPFLKNSIPRSFLFEKYAERQIAP